MNIFWIRWKTIVLHLRIFLCDQDLCEGYRREALQEHFSFDSRLQFPRRVLLRTLFGVWTGGVCDLSSWGPEVKVGIVSTYTFDLRGLVAGVTASKIIGC